MYIKKWSTKSFERAMKILKGLTKIDEISGCLQIMIDEENFQGVIGKVYDELRELVAETSHKGWLEEFGCNWMKVALVKNHSVVINSKHSRYFTVVQLDSFDSF